MPSCIGTSVGYVKWTLLWKWTMCERVQWLFVVYLLYAGLACSHVMNVYWRLHVAKGSTARLAIWRTLCGGIQGCDKVEPMSRPSVPYIPKYIYTCTFAWLLITFIQYYLVLYFSLRDLRRLWLARRVPRCARLSSQLVPTRLECNQTRLLCDSADNNVRGMIFRAPLTYRYLMATTTHLRVHTRPVRHP